MGHRGTRKRDPVTHRDRPAGGSTYLASNLLDPAARAQQPEHTDFSPTIWDWDAEGV